MRGRKGWEQRQKRKFKDLHICPDTPIIYDKMIPVDMVHSYRRDGFVKIAKAFSPEEILELRQEADRLSCCAIFPWTVSPMPPSTSGPLCLAHYFVFLAEG